MKYCSKCGNQILDEAIFCPKCGCSTSSFNNVSKSNSDGLKIAAKILMIITTVTTGIYIIPLCWMLPMTLSYCNKVKNNEPVSTGFKVCCILFANTIAGILMLCADD